MSRKARNLSFSATFQAGISPFTIRENMLAIALRFII
jgi:hypothetical protein